MQRFGRTLFRRTQRFCTDCVPVAKVSIATTVGIPVGLGVARCFFVDLFVQRCDSNFQSFNWIKAAAFGVYGGITCAMIVPMQVFVYAKWIAQNPTQKLRPLAAAIFDIAVVLPLTDLPVYYLISTMACNHQGFRNDISNAWQSYKDYVFVDTQAAASIWVPINILNFFLVPAQYRGLVFAAGGCAWSAYFCYLKSAEKSTSGGNPHRPTADFETFEWAMALMGKQMFDLMDSDKSGCISEQEFSKWLAGSTRLISPSDRKTIFETLDANKSGEISREEFVAYLEDLQLTRDGRSHILAQFRETDENGDGKLSTEELQDFLKEIGISQGAELVLKQYDANGDGCITIEEVEAHFKQFYGLQ